MKPKDTAVIEAGAGATPKGDPKFSPEFKQAAVARLRAPGTNATLLAIELGIRRNQLYKWAKAFDRQAPGETFRSPGRPPASEDTEVVRLRKALEESQMELAVLKKFHAYLTHLKK